MILMSTAVVFAVTVVVFVIELAVAYRLGRHMAAMGEPLTPPKKRRSSDDC